MTEKAKEFITPLTVATLSKNPVLTDFFNPENGDWNSHVKLALWADLFVIAPATANTIAKMACGIADNLLLTTCLSARCKILLAPAMDFDMYLHQATRNNLQTLKDRGCLFVEAQSGELASGLSGQGRMAEPEQIFEAVEDFFSVDLPLKGKKVLITAGPTREMIDPVRFISNFSTGKMGYALAENLAMRGCSVVLISGPVNLKIDNPLIEVVDVVSADDMFQACVNRFPQCDAAILSAAVADFAPVLSADSKIKKSGNEPLILSLMPTKDIAAQLGKMKTTHQICVGFALETDNEVANARKKLLSKNSDFIVLNSLNDNGAGFGFDTNKISIIYKDNSVKNFSLKSKKEVASDIVDELFTLLKEKTDIIN